MNAAALMPVTLMQLPGVKCHQKNMSVSDATQRRSFFLKSIMSGLTAYLLNVSTFELVLRIHSIALE